MRRHRPWFLLVLATAGLACRVAAAAPDAVPNEYGDAPEGALAYPASGVIGRFPTCVTVGPGGWVVHAPVGKAYLGASCDFEAEGNAGNCGTFPPYDADECWDDGDSGLMFPPAWTLDAARACVPCDPSQRTDALGTVCVLAKWGTDLDVLVTNRSTGNRYLNVLFDWDQNGQWGGASPCPAATAPEQVLVDFRIPPGFSGPVSNLDPPSFRIGPNSGHVWCRLTIGDHTVGAAWDGSGSFEDGETSDHLLLVDAVAPELEYGDAPEGTAAYATGVMGMFPTCVSVGPAAFISHGAAGGAWLGPAVDYEPDGNAGACPGFAPFDADECWNDGDSGLIYPPAWTLDGAFTTGPCQPNAVTALGLTCNNAAWGTNLDLQVTNASQFPRYVNVLFDWDQNGQWGWASDCGANLAQEHALVNFVVPSGFAGPLSALGPPPFLIGPNDDLVWSRFTISDAPVASVWDGSGIFADGETSDFLLRVDPDLTGVEGGGGATWLDVAQPNPFTATTTIGCDLRAAGAVHLAVYDVAGRLVRTLADATLEAGHHAFAWDGRTAAGGTAAAGVYFVRLRADGQTRTGRLIRVR